MWFISNPDNFDDVVCAVRPTTYQPDSRDDVARAQSSPVTSVLPSFILPTPEMASSTGVASAAVLLMPMQAWYSVKSAGYETQDTAALNIKSKSKNLRCDIVARLSPITASLNGVPDPLAPSRNWTRNGTTIFHAFPAATHSPSSVRYLPHRINPLRSFLRKGAPPSSAKKSIDSRTILLHLLLTTEATEQRSLSAFYGVIAWLAFSYTTILI